MFKPSIGSVVWTAALTACTSTTSAPARPAAATDGLLPHAFFAQGPQFSQVRLSPDGRRICTVSQIEGRRGLAFFDAKTLALIGAFRLEQNHDVIRYAWVSNERVALEIGEQVGWFEGTQRYGEIYGVDWNGKNARMLFGFRAAGFQTGSKLRQASADRAWGVILDPLPKDPETMLVLARPWNIGHGDIDRRPMQVFRVDVRTGTKRGRIHVPDHITDAEADAQGNLHWVRVTRDGDRSHLMVRQGEGWTSVAEPRFTSAVSLLEYDSDSDTLYVTDNDEQGQPAVYAVGPDRKKTKVAQQGSIQPNAFVFDHTSKLAAVEYHHHYPKTHVIDKNGVVAKLTQALSSQYKGRHLRISSLSADGTRAIIYAFADRDPGTYFLVDLTTYDATPLFAVYKDARPELHAPVEAIQFKASDGLTIYGYVTFPAQGSDKNLPLVVMPHGGPVSRDYWGFDSDAQFLASRGYAVLQVNFRGSYGYGAAYERAGYKQWGDRIQQDIIEATRWAIAEGIADKKRIAIFGASFGAYSALMSSILAPDLFQCAIGYAGLYDLELAHQEGDIIASEAGRIILDRYIGKNADQLRAYSPRHRAAEIRAPLLLIHGKDDPRTPFSQAEGMREALDALNKPYEWYVESGEGHGFVNPRNRQNVYRRVEAFLARHL